MIYLAVLTILMAAWGFCTGNVEGYKNEPGPTPQTPYHHEFRSLQDGLVLLIIITGWAAALAGADFLRMLDVLVLSYGAQDGLCRPRPVNGGRPAHGTARFPAEAGGSGPTRRRLSIG